MDELSFRTLRDALDALQHSSQGSALSEILNRYGHEMTIEQKLQIATTLKKSELSKISQHDKIIWDNDWF